MASLVHVLNAIGTTSKIQSTKNIRSMQSMHIDTEKCIGCQKSSHPLWACISFKRQPVSKRRELVQNSQLCFNCIRPGYFQSNCSSKHNCHHCEQSHHTLLHIKTSSLSSTSGSSSSNKNASLSSSTSSAASISNKYSSVASSSHSS